MPAAAVIPAPLAYTTFVAVKRLVVELVTLNIELLSIETFTNFFDLGTVDQPQRSKHAISRRTFGHGMPLFTFTAEHAQGSARLLSLLESRWR